MHRTARLRRVVLIGGLFLLAGSTVQAVDSPTLHRVRVVIVHPEREPAQVTRDRIKVFDQCFRTARYASSQSFGQSPEDILADNPDVELVVAGSFRQDEDEALVVTLHWRPAGQYTMSGSGDSAEEIQSLANEVIRYIEGELQTPLKTYRRTLTRDALDQKLDQATEQFEQGQYEDAAAAVRSILGDRPTDTEIQYRCHYLLGHCLKAQDHLEDAWSEFEAADELSGEDDSALLELGNVAFLQQRYPVALDRYMAVRARRGVNALKAQWNIVLIRQTQGELDMAVSALAEIPEGSIHTLDRGKLARIVNHAVSQRQERQQFFALMWKCLGGVAVVVIIAIIVVMYRRAMRIAEVTPAQRLDFAGKLMGGLFSMLSLVGGTMLGLLLAR